jgi:phage N-6-adenine-methyltransferase
VRRKVINKRLENALGKALRSARKKAGLRQADLARKTGLSNPAIGNLEHSKGNLATWNRVLAKLQLGVRGRNLPAASSVGKSVQLLRKRRSLSGRELAAAIGVSHPSIVALERRSAGRLSTLNGALVFLGAAPVLVRKGDRVKFYADAAQSSAHHAWKTPQWLLKSLYKVFGTFDLDPCSPSAKRRGASVRAKVYFTKADDGLSLSWHGNVFVNPPYGRELQAWTAKAKAEVFSGNAQMVCALIPARTDTTWWHRDIVNHATVLFLQGRLSFDDSGQSAPFPSALVLWGASEKQVAGVVEVIPNVWNPFAKVGVKVADPSKKTRPRAF